MLEVGPGEGLGIGPAVGRGLGPGRGPRVGPGVGPIGLVSVSLIFTQCSKPKKSCTVDGLRSIPIAGNQRELLSSLTF